MRLSSITSLVSFSALSLSVALAQKSPFALVVLSNDKAHNNYTLIPCQKGKQGPYDPGLCPLAQFGYPLADYEAAFNLSQTSNANSGVGYLTYELKNRRTSTGLANVTAPMAFTNKGSYQIPVFGYAGFDTASKVSFSSSNYLGVPEGSGAKYDRWYICDIDGGLIYPSIVWSSGPAAPPLSSCVKVTIQRAW